MHVRLKRLQCIKHIVHTPWHYGCTYNVGVNTAAQPHNEVCTSQESSTVTLDGVLQDTEGIQAQEIAYQHIRRSLQEVHNLSRYHGLRAALNMLASQVL